MTGMCRTRFPPRVWVSLIVANRVWPSGTRFASMVMLNDRVDRALTMIDDATVILKSLGLETVIRQSDRLLSTLRTVRVTVTTPGMLGW